MNEIMVSIVCDVFNHEHYLRQCLDGIIMQQTDFAFEILIHDDASTDKSVEIIQEYVDKYPHLFKPIYQKENKFSKGISIWKDIQFPRAQGKYIAMCEGDDYWTDPQKLQKQVDFMEANTEYSMCFHKVEVLSHNSNDIGLYDHLCERAYSAYEIYDKWTIPTCSVLYSRNNLKLLRPKKCLFGDIVLFLSLANGGKLFCLDFIGGVYRRHQGGVSTQNNNELYKALYYQYKEMEMLFPNVREISKRKQRDYLSCLIYDKNSVDTWKYRFSYMWLNKKLFFSSFLTTTILSYMIKPFINKVCNH